MHCIRTVFLILVLVAHLAAQTTVIGGGSFDLDPCENDGDAWLYNAASGEMECAQPPGAGGGEANTASNLGAGIGVWEDKNGVDLRFNSLVSANNLLTITEDDLNNEIDFTITLDNLTQITTRDYSDLQNIPTEFTPSAHVLVSATHTASGLTIGHMLRATGATSFAFEAILDTDLPSNVVLDDEANVFTTAGGVTLDNQLGIRMREQTASGTDYFELRAPATLSAPFTITWAATGECTGLNDGALTLNASGEVVCTDDESGVGDADSIQVEDSDDGGTFTAVDTSARFEDQGDIDFQLSGAGNPHTILGVVRANSVALATDTTGNFVGTVAAGTGVAVTGADAENATKTVVLDYSDAGADPALGAGEARFSNEGASPSGIVFEGDTADAIETRLRVTDPTGSDKVATLPDASGEISLLGQSIDLATEVTGQLGDTSLANDAVDGGVGGEIEDETITAADLAPNSVAASELDENAVESELEMVLDLQDLQGTLGASQLDQTAAYTWTGAHDFSGGQTRLYQAATLAATECDEASEEGRIGWDTDATSGQRLKGCEVGTGWVTQGGGGGGGGSHELLSATHTDTLAATVVRGDVIIANSSPAWSRLAIGGVATFLRSDGTDPAWAAIAAGDVPNLENLNGTLDVASGGTGATTLTGILQGNGTSAVTAIANSSTVGQVFRVTGASTYAWGSLDLADADAITGLLPTGNAAAAFLIEGDVGDGLEVVTNTLNVNSDEAGFLDDAVALSCGAGTLGQLAIVDGGSVLNFCDDQATPAQQYLALGASDGDALAGDSATGFFDAGTFEDARVDGSLESDEIDHDATLNFVANEHIDHTAVSLTGGSGVAAIGDISASRTVDLDFASETEDATPDNADLVLVEDAVTAGQFRKVQLQNLPGGGSANALVDDTANALDNAIRVSVGTSGRETEETGATIDPANDNFATPGTISAGSASTPTNILGVTDDVMPGAPGSANQFNLGVNRTTGNLEVHRNGQASADVGGVAEAAFPVYIPSGGCDNATAGPVLDIPTSNGGAVACYGTSPQRFGGIDFADGASALTSGSHHRLPAKWTGAVDIEFDWFSGSTSTNSAVWTVATACIADGEDLLAPTYNATQTVADANNATANTRNSASITGITMTGCEAGETLFVRVGRDPTNGSDTLAATAVLLGVELTIRRGL